MRPTEALRNSVFVRLHDRHVQWLMDAAAQARTTPSAMIRKLLEEAANRDLLQGKDDAQDH